MQDFFANICDIGHFSPQKERKFYSDINVFEFFWAVQKMREIYFQYLFSCEYTTSDTGWWYHSIKYAKPRKPP